jgi:hypothetical protein
MFSPREQSAGAMRIDSAIMVKTIILRITIPIPNTIIIDLLEFIGDRPESMKR